MEPDVTAAPVDTPTPEPTLAEHEAQYSNPPKANGAAPAAVAPAEPEDAPSLGGEAPAAGERDEQGRFKGRHRAKSQQAGPADVPRIAELTKKLRDAEARAADLEARMSRPSEPVARQPEPTRQPASAPMELPAGFPPEPKPEDFPDDVLKYTAAQARWAAKAEIALDNIARQQRDVEAQRTQGFLSRINDAKQVYDDFEDVALRQPTRIPQGSTVDHYVMEHKAGAHLLYHFQTHADELDRVLALAPLDQVDALSLLAQRLTAPPTRSQAASTGSAAAPLVSTVAKPPNPVRTGPMKSGDEPPSDEASILDHERFYFKQRR